MAERKLFLKIRCNICKGSRRYSAGGHYDAASPAKWNVCSYCDPGGTTYIEASFNIILDYLRSLSEEQRILIIEQLTS